MANADFALDTKKDDATLKYLEWLREAFASGKSLIGLIRDVAALGWGEGRLQPSEYFLYRLYDDARFPGETKRTFLGGDRLAQLLNALDMPWPKIANDKPTFTALLRGHDLPIPETQAMRHKVRTFPGALTLHAKADVERFLRQQADYPLFGKPTNKVCSLGVANIERFDKGSDCIVTKMGRRVPIGVFADEVEKYAEGGYLFQTRLTPHPKIIGVVGDQISTVRMFVLVDDKGPLLLRASWKIPSGVSVADNFWRAGNMLGGLDVDTGKVIRVLRRRAVARKRSTSIRKRDDVRWARISRMGANARGRDAGRGGGSVLPFTGLGRGCLPIGGRSSSSWKETAAIPSWSNCASTLDYFKVDTWSLPPMQWKGRRRKRTRLKRGCERLRTNLSQLSLRQPQCTATPTVREENEELCASGTSA